MLIILFSFNRKFEWKVEVNRSFDFSLENYRRPNRTAFYSSIYIERRIDYGHSNSFRLITSTWQANRRINNRFVARH